MKRTSEERERSDKWLLVAFGLLERALALKTKARHNAFLWYEKANAMGWVSLCKKKLNDGVERKRAVAVREKR